MTPKEVAELLCDIRDSYPMRRFDMTERVVEVWHEDLRDMPVEKVRENFRKHRRNSAYVPTLADLLGNTVKEKIGDPFAGAPLIWPDPDMEGERN